MAGKSETKPIGMIELLFSCGVVVIAILSVLAATTIAIEIRHDFATYEKYVKQVIEERAKPKTGLFETCTWVDFGRTKYTGIAGHSTGNWWCQSLFGWYEWAAIMTE